MLFKFQHAWGKWNNQTINSISFFFFLYIELEAVSSPSFEHFFSFWFFIIFSNIRSVRTNLCAPRLIPWYTCYFPLTQVPGSSIHQSLDRWENHLVLRLHWNLNLRPHGSQSTSSLNASSFLLFIRKRKFRACNPKSTAIASILQRLNTKQCFGLHVNLFG